MKTKVALLLPVAFALALTLPGAGREGFLHEDEWRNAVMAREMALQPTVHPRLHGGLYADYPPLYFWTAMPVIAAQGGFTPLAVRLPSALGAALLAFGTALLALRLGSTRMTALAAGVLVSVIPALHYEERRAMIDPLFSGLACVSVALLAEASVGAFVLGCFFLALTWLTKGPLGAVVVGLALVGGEGLLACRDRAGLLARAQRLSRFTVVTLLVAFAWFAYAYARHGQKFGDNLLYEQTLGRFLPEHNKQHQKPWHFYLATTLPALLPVLLFALRPKLTRASVFALGWFLLELVFFSSGNTKRSYYLMPAYPAVALLAASFFEVELPESWTYVWQTAFAWILVVGLVLGGLLGFYAKELRDYGLALAVAATLGYVSFRGLVSRKKPALAVAAALGFILAAVSATLVPALARRHGQKDLAAKLAGVKHVAVSPGGMHREALCFFFGPSPLEGTDNIESNDEHPNVPGIKKWLAQFPPGEAVVLVQRRDVEGDYPPFHDSSLVPLAASDDEESSEAYVAIGRRP